MKKIISFLLATIMLLGMFSIGTFAETPLTLDMKAVEGASVRIGDVAGIRFQTMINKAELDAIVTANGASNVEIGTLITPTQYVKGASAFTMEALDAYKEVKGFENAAYVKVKATYANPFDTETVEDTEYYVYAGSLENILDDNVMLSFSGIGYVKVGDEVVYAEYNEADSSRTVGYVAYRAYLANDENLGTDGKNLIDDFANKFLVTKLGNDAPDISKVRYFEAYDDMANTADFADATTFLGWKDNFCASGANYIYGKDVKAKYNNGTLVFNTTQSAREGHTEEQEYIDNWESTMTGHDMAHSLLTIPGLNSDILFANGEDTFVLQFDVVFGGTKGGGIGLAVCDDDTWQSRGRFLTNDNSAWLFVAEAAGTTRWFSQQTYTGTIGNNKLTITYTIHKDMVDNTYSVYNHADQTTQTLDGLLWNTDQTNGTYSIGLYFVNADTITVDNLLVYSYCDGGNL
ncbi:MAG: hypothetical protein IJZ83_04920 [Clostridia bacterium]|nr:hypothetical protein [Clostridia bacterium]